MTGHFPRWKETSSIELAENAPNSVSSTGLGDLQMEG